MTTIRRLERDDDAEVTRLFKEAFGEGDDTTPHVNPIDRPGRRFWVAEEDGHLIGSTVDREFDTWFGDVAVPTAGIGGVTVRAEARGRGLVTPLFEHMLAESRRRGAVISALYPTSPGIYRRFGYAPVVDLMELRVRTRDLAVPGDTVPVRRATAADLPAIREVYTRWAVAHNGPLTRSGVSFPDTDEDALKAVSGITVAESGSGGVSGYVSWDRGSGYGAEASIKVWDLHADDAASLTSLMNAIGSFSSVADTTVIRTSGDPEWRHLLRQGSVQQVHRNPYAMTVLDVRVLELLRYPDGLELVLPFVWRGEGHVLSVASGRGHVETGEVGPVRQIDAAGLALTISGAQRSAALRRLGHLTGGVGHDEFWDFLFGSRQPAVRDYY